MIGQAAVRNVSSSDTRGDAWWFHPMFAFLHIPKTAGTTVREMLREAIRPRNPLVIDDVSRIAYRTDAELASHDFVAGHFGVALFGRLPREAKRFTVLRHPLARVQSQYRYLRRLASLDVDFNGYANCLRGRSLHEILQDRSDPFLNSLFRDTQTWALVTDYQHQYRDHCGDPSAALDLAKRNLMAFDAFGLVERMHDTIIDLNRRFGWSLDPKLWAQVRENGSPGGFDEGTEDDVTLADLVRTNNPLDWALHEWATMVFEQRTAEVPAAGIPPSTTRAGTDDSGEVASLHIDPERADGAVSFELMRIRAFAAERASGSLRRLNEETKAWALRAESSLAKERALSADLRAWALRAEEMLARERETTARLRALVSRDHGGEP